MVTRDSAKVWQQITSDYLHPIQRNPFSMTALMTRYLVPWLKMIPLSASWDDLSNNTS